MGSSIGTPPRCPRSPRRPFEFRIATLRNRVPHVRAFGLDFAIQPEDWRQVVLGGGLRVNALLQAKPSDPVGLGRSPDNVAYVVGVRAHATMMPAATCWESLLTSPCPSRAEGSVPYHRVRGAYPLLGTTVDRNGQTP